MSDWPASLGIKVKQLTQQFLIMTFWQKEIMANYEKEKKTFAFQQYTVWCPVKFHRFTAKTCL